MSGTTAIFLTYSHRPHFDEKDYEGFLREHDNPFFNSIAGITRYENWKLVHPYPETLGFDYFDLIYLDGSRSLKDVWFDAELTVFRRNWVAVWGYGSSPPPLVNAQGYAMRGDTVPALELSGKAVLAFRPEEERRPGDWVVEAAMPKHYAFAEGQAPSPWHDEGFDRSILPGLCLGLGEASSSGPAFRVSRIAPTAVSAN